MNQRKQHDGPEPDAANAMRPNWTVPACLGMILLATVAAYWPAMNGAALWDDDAHLTKPELQSWSGLGRIWTDPTATQQYYPLLHSAFWLEHELWGDAMFGYHAITLAWHLVAVLLLYSILRKLKIPGALLAAAIFALHPVMVESVAWISEQKNTLSAVFYLSAMRVYLEFDESRKGALYTLSLTLFVLGLLTKTVTATLPAALLVIFWWQRGRVEWKRDVRPLVPFFMLGAVAGCVTAWVEYHLIGAKGESFELSLSQRILLAGRAPWFYLSKLVWPANLAFIYPRWSLDASVWWQWLFPLATALTLVVLWSIRKNLRGPLAAGLLFVGTLFPVLGFLNVYPFLFSFVADHFQYLASTAVIVFAAAAIALALRNVARGFRRAGVVICVLILATFGLLTFRQSGMYADSIRLYEATVSRNPECWMAHYNLANTLMSAKRIEPAIQHFRKAILINPNAIDSRVNLGVALTNAGQLQEAADVYRETAQMFPDAYEPQCNLGGVLVLMGKYAEAIEAFEAALAIRPNDPRTLNWIAVALLRQNRFTDALLYTERALKADPELADAYDNMGLILVHSGRVPEAIDQFKTALKYNPNDYSAHNNLGLLYAGQKDIPNAIHSFESAVRVNPSSADAQNNLGELLRQAGQIEQSITHLEAAVRLAPTFARPHLNLARAYAVLDRGEEAVASAEKGLELARSANLAEVETAIETWLKHYRIELERGNVEENNADSK